MMAGWPLAGVTGNYLLGHVRAVLPGREIDDALIAVADGRIAAVQSHPPSVTCDVDGQGLLCLPGLIDVHSDGLERELSPRPGVDVPAEFAMLSFDGTLRAAGVTTVFHGAGFEESDAGSGLGRSIAKAEQICDLASSWHSVAVDHRVLYRLDVRSLPGLKALERKLATNDGAPALVSYEDHTPGQGQYADRTQYERYIASSRGISATAAKTVVDTLIATRTERLGAREKSLTWLSELAREGRIRLLGHDPDTAAAIDTLRAQRGSAAEFPTTIEAAKAAHDNGLPVLMGAPNVVRGRSHSGNASARELIAKGLVTALASDYLPYGLLASVTVLADEGICSLARAVALVTSGPAAVAGLTDRGRIAPGMRADLILVDATARWPTVRAVLTGSTSTD